MKQAPHLSGVLDRVTAERVVVVPVFAGQGYYTDILIPREMGLTGPVTQRDGRCIHLTAPVGCDRRIPGIMACRADGVLRDAGIDPTGASLLLIAHGSSRPGGAGQTPKAIATAIAAMDHFAETHLVFLEQPPFARDWPKLIAENADVVALPLLVAQGMHASQDIPPLFGLTPGQTGPVISHGRRIWLATGLGAEPDLVEVVSDIILAAAPQ